MNYAEMSDAEIAEAVIKTINLNDCEYWRPSATGRGVVIINDDDDTVRTFDPCNNPSDMWPLIVENRIATLPYGRNGLWMAAGNGYRYHHTNPLRAAAIVYLMMKGAGK
ncbi:phage protein NinX family protein [Edwardsiella piscicida]